MKMSDYDGKWSLGVRRRVASCLTSCKEFHLATPENLTDDEFLDQEILRRGLYGWKMSYSTAFGDISADEYVRIVDLYADHGLL